MANKFKLVPKMQGNRAIIYMLLADQRTIELLWVVFPNDNQINDNCEALDDMVKVLSKRIRKSI